MFDLSYKIVSDWNFSTGFENFDRSGAFITIDEEERFSNATSSYSLFADGILKHGVYSKANSLFIYYFNYNSSNDELFLERVEIQETPIAGYSPRFIKDNFGFYNIVYYDHQIGALRLCRAFDDGSFDWDLSNIDFLTSDIPLGKRSLDIVANDNLHLVFIYNSGISKIVRYGVFDNNDWNLTDIPTVDINGEIKTVSIIQDKNNDVFVFVGTSEGLFCYSKQSNEWVLEDFSIDRNGVSEMEVVYSAMTELSHIAYVANSEVRYQYFSHSNFVFNNNYKFIDFDSSSVSIDVDLFARPLITYSHIEDAMPLSVFLKYATGDSSGGNWRSFNLDSSTTGFKTGSFSDVSFDDNNDLFILYLDDGVTLYNGSNDLGGNDLIIWKDATFRNNLISSNNPPEISFNGNFVNFSRDQQEYFYISDNDSIGLNQKEVFSISFLISPNGKISDEQVFISHDGYDIFLSGDNGLTLGFRMKTSLNELEVMVTELPAKEFTKCSFVYSGYDVKIYYKNSNTDGFQVSRFDINGDIANIGMPFTIGAKATLSSSPYMYPISENAFSDFYDGSLSFIKFWKRELNYEEATYDNTVIDYDQGLDPYSNNIDYLTMENGFGINYYYLKGENLSVDDLGGVGTTSLLDYSTFNQEERLTNSSDLSLNPHGFKGSRGGTNILWSDKRDGNADIYMIKSNSNNKAARANEASFIKFSGFGGFINASTNILIDANANFLNSGVVKGDYINITNGSDHIGRKIPILDIVGDTQLVLGVYFSDKVTNIGYFIDSNKLYNIDESIVQITDFGQFNSSNPVGISDSIGDSHIVWQSFFGNNYGVYYKRYRPFFNDEQVLGVVKIDGGVGDSLNPSISISRQDVLHLVWENRDSISGSILYASSTNVNGVYDKEPAVVKWSSSSYGGRDLLISGNINAKKPKISIDSNGYIHILFIGEEGGSSQVYYVNNLLGSFSAPITVTAFDGIVSDIDLAISPSDDILLVLSADSDGNNDIYIVKREFNTSEWSSLIKIFDSTNNSISPSVSIGTNNVANIFWTERASVTSVINYAEYDLSNGNLKINDNGNVSSFPNNSLNVNNIVDDTNTIYVSWEDSRNVSGGSLNTEVYKNTLSTLIPYEQEKEKTLPDANNEGILEEINTLIVGNRFPDSIPGSVIPPSNESVDSLKITFEDGLSSYTTIGGESLDNIVFSSRSINIKIEGLPNTLAYRVKNNDDSSEMFSEFFPFTIDENPNTTVFEWLLTKGNSQKEVCIQLYTLQGITSIVCTTMFLNQSNIYQVSLFKDNNGQIGEAVSTIYNDKLALKSNTYWAKIEMFSFVDIETEKVIFDVVMQGNDILGVETMYEEGAFIGSFNIQPQDGVRYIDGEAKIIAKIVDK